jgi:hypothetical protein
MHGRSAAQFKDRGAFSDIIAEKPDARGLGAWRLTEVPERILIEDAYCYLRESFRAFCNV